LVKASHTSCLFLAVIEVVTLAECKQVAALLASDIVGFNASLATQSQAGIVAITLRATIAAIRVTILNASIEFVVDKTIAGLVELDTWLMYGVALRTVGKSSRLLLTIAVCLTVGVTYAREEGAGVGAFG